MSAPIGVFDSGLGGLSVAAQIMRRLPNERMVYFADSAHLPYGERPLDEIRGFALAITGYLAALGAKAVVMACNMSSAVASDAARLEHPGITVLGVIDPGAAAAVRVSNGQPIGVLATTGTVKSGAYPQAIRSLGCTARVFQQACPKFVPLVESGRSESEEAEAAACDYVGRLLDHGCRTLILGCTHYPFVRKVIESAAGSEIAIVDPAEETARVLQNKLTERNCLSDALAGPHEFCASGPAEDFTTLGSAFLGSRIEHVKPVLWGVDIGRVKTDSVV